MTLQSIPGIGGTTTTTTTTPTTSPSVVADIAGTVTDTKAANGIITNPKGFNNFPECPGANQTLNALIKGNFTQGLDLGLAALAAVE